MKMERLEIKQFRGLKNLSLKRLGNINLLLGNNDSGKTTVLEAVQMFENPDSINAIIYSARETRLPDIRFFSRDNYSFFECLIDLFPFEQQEHKEISLCAGIDGSSKHLTISGELARVLRTVSEEEISGHTRKRKNVQLSDQDVLTFHGTLRTCENETPIKIDEFHRPEMIPKPNKSSCPIAYMAPGDHLSRNNNSNLYRLTKQRELEIVKLLQLIDPEIEGFKLQPNSATGSTNQTIEHKRFGNVPLYTYGDGMKKAMSLVTHIMDAKNGILLIDEIETSLQASNLQHVFAWLLHACRHFHVQLFATTHSLEAVSALVSCAVEDTESELVCYRLEADNGQAYAKRFSESDLDSMVNGRGIDVR